MRLGIDGSNIRAGGGLVHLQEFLRFAEPEKHGFSKVVLWCTKPTAETIEKKPWLEIISPPALNKSIFHKLYWLKFNFKKALKEQKVDTLYSPGAIPINFTPTISFCQNLLPFEEEERNRFGRSLVKFRLKLLERSQTKSFRKAAGVVFLTQYSIDKLLPAIPELKNKSTVIPHGIHSRFFQQNREIADYSEEKTFRLVYVSIVNMYKHQWNVARAVKVLLKKGIKVQLDLVGPAYGPAVELLKEELGEDLNNQPEIIYHGKLPHQEIHKIYAQADIFVFASSCETFGMILLEAMAGHLPIACSNMSSLPETLQDGGVYFDPLNPKEIATVLEDFIKDGTKRRACAQRAYELAGTYSWERCCDETFSFIGNHSKPSS